MIVLWWQSRHVTSNSPGSTLRSNRVGGPVMVQVLPQSAPPWSAASRASAGAVPAPPESKLVSLIEEITPAGSNGELPLQACQRGGSHPLNLQQELIK